jgi:hypothetical protein
MTNFNRIIRQIAIIIHPIFTKPFIGIGQEFHAFTKRLDFNESLHFIQFQKHTFRDQIMNHYSIGMIKKKFLNPSGLSYLHCVDISNDLWNKDFNISFSLQLKCISAFGTNNGQQFLFRMFKLAICEYPFFSLDSMEFMSKQDQTADNYYPNFDRNEFVQYQPLLFTTTLTEDDQHLLYKCFHIIKHTHNPVNYYQHLCVYYDKYGIPTITSNIQPRNAKQVNLKQVCLFYYCELRQRRTIHKFYVQWVETQNAIEFTRSRKNSDSKQYHSRKWFVDQIICKFSQTAIIRVGIIQFSLAKKYTPCTYYVSIVILRSARKHDFTTGIAGMERNIIDRMHPDMHPVLYTNIKDLGF